MNYLELCQRTARETGTISGGSSPTTVIGQVGRLGHIVEWVNQAWQDIQNSRQGWRWMRTEFTNTVLTGSPLYTAASFSLTRLGEWVTDEGSLSLYSALADEAPLTFIEWSIWRQIYQRGVQTNNRPIHFSVSPSNELAFGPTPDVAYTIRGEYYKTPQILSANADIPECPVRYHDVIWLRALQFAEEFDESAQQLAWLPTRYAAAKDALEKSQLPKIQIGSWPLA